LDLLYTKSQPHLLAMRNVKGTIHLYVKIRMAKIAHGIFSLLGILFI